MVKHSLVRFAITGEKISAQSLKILTGKVLVAVLVFFNDLIFFNNLRLILD